jgi:hypothetical protein
MKDMFDGIVTKRKKRDELRSRDSGPSHVERIPEEKSKWDVYPKAADGWLKGQCSFEAAYGRCGLRGAVAIDGSRKVCTFHYHIRGRELSLDSFRIFMADEIAQGDKSWQKHDDIWWWDRITGRKQPFTSTEEDLARSAAARDRMMRAMEGT